MKLEGFRRLEVHVPIEQWDRMEDARGEITRSEWTRQALQLRLGVVWNDPADVPGNPKGTAKAVRDAAVLKGLAADRKLSPRERLAQRTAELRGK